MRNGTTLALVAAATLTLANNAVAEEVYECDLSGLPDEVTEIKYGNYDNGRLFVACVHYNSRWRLGCMTANVPDDDEEFVSIIPPDNPGTFVRQSGRLTCYLGASPYTITKFDLAGWDGSVTLDTGVDNRVSPTHVNGVRFYGTDGRDLFLGTQGDDYVALGNDNPDGWGHWEYAQTRDGDDIAVGGAGDCILDSYDGNDALYALNLRGDFCELQGGWHEDALYGWYGDDYIFGGCDADRLYGYWGDDTLYGVWNNEPNDPGDYLDGFEEPGDRDGCRASGGTVVNCEFYY